MERISEADVRILQNIYSQPGKVEVFKVQQIRNGNVLCMKKIFVKDLKEAVNKQSEFIAMAQLNNDGILKFISASFGSSGNQISHIIIFTEFCEEGDLKSFITRRIQSETYFSQNELLDYLKQLLTTFKFMQEKSMCHRNIKPQNLFIFQNGTKIKIGNFGYVINEDDIQGRSVAGTPLYLSPILREYCAQGGSMFGINHNIYKSDVYSLGLTFLYLASLRPPNDLTSLNGLEQMINNRLSEIRSSYPKLVTYLELMLKVDENQRFDFIELEKKMKSERVFGVLSSNNFSGINRKILMKIETKCSECGGGFDESKLLLYNLGVICFECKSKFENSIIKRDLFHGQSKHKLTNNYCNQCNLTFCPYCKKIHRETIACNKLENQSDYAYFLCPDCNLEVKLYETGIFSNCSNGHYYCQICQDYFSLRLHSDCKIFFCGFFAYSFN